MRSENSFETKSINHDCDGGELSLVLLGTRKKYMQRLFLTVRFCIRVQFFRSLKKAPIEDEVSSSPLSSIPYVSLPSDPRLSSGKLPKTSSSQDEHVVDIEPDNEEHSRLKLARIIKERDLCGLKNFGGIGKVASVLGSDLENGKKAPEASEEFNSQDMICGNGFFYYFWKACNRPTIVLLFVSAGLSFGIEMKEQGPRYGWHDGAAILFALFLLVLFPSVSNCVNERKLQKKRHKKQNKLNIEVTRSGIISSIPASNMKEGDVVNLKMGDPVPADGLFVNGMDLEVDEVVNSKIDGDLNPFLFSGSKVSKGHGRMLVTSVGSNTLMGKDLSLVNEDSGGKSLLQTQIEKPNDYADNLGLSVTVLIALVVLIRLLCKGQQENDDVLPELKGNTKIRVLTKIFEIILLKPTGRVRILAGALTAVVIGIQHAMPFAITVSLSCWNEKVELLGSKLWNSSATGTMGLVTVICINITGGFMCETVEVKNFYMGEKDVNTDMNSETDQAVTEALCRGICASTCVRGFSATPVNDLLISNWAKSRWGRSMKLPDLFSVHEYRRLSSNNNGSLVLLKKEGEDENSVHLHKEGSASMILNSCSHYYNSKGELHAIEDQKKNFESIIGEMEEKGLRAIAFASKKADISNVNEDGLRLLAIAGLKYSCSEEIETTIRNVKNAGVYIKLVSGDELSVAKAIAHALGIIENGLNVEDFGQQFRDLNVSARMEKIEQKIEQIAVIGSCVPEDMLLVVKCLQKKDHVVAFIGGSSVTDISVMKEADVGISKQTQSTEMVREISDLVIPDENSLLKIMHYGKCSYLNIQKFTELQLTTCISGLLINLVAAICSWDSPLNVIQLSWVNLVMCFLGSLMMAMDLNHERQSDKPEKRTQPLVTRLIWKHILIQALYQSSFLLILHLVGLAIPNMTEPVWKSLVFNSFMLCQIFNLFKAMNIFDTNVIQTLLRHYCFCVWAGIFLVLQVLVVEFAASARLNLIYWAISFIIAALPWTTECALRIISASFTDYFHRSDNSRRVMSLLYVPFWWIPVFTVFIFSVTYTIYYPGKVSTFR